MNTNPNWSLKNYYPPLDNIDGTTGSTVIVSQTLSPYTTFQLFSLNSSEVKNISLNIFHELSFSVIGTMTLQIDATSQTLTDIDYKLTYPQLNTQNVIITLGVNSTLNGIISS